MDIRDLAYWAKEAKKKIIFDQLRRIQAARSAQVKDDVFQNIVAQLENELKKIQIGEKKFYQSSWEELRRTARV